MLHSHTVGKGIWIEHSRNGVQLPDIDSNYDYDFNFQDVVLLRNEVKILPGDDIQVFCDYDTSNRKQVTIGGEGTLDEMCLAFLLVYPRPQLSVCLSQIDSSQFSSYIFQAAIRGYYVDMVNQSADDATRERQFVESAKNMNWNSDGAYNLWNDAYWSSKSRQYFCNGPFHNNLVGALSYVGNSTLLPDITHPLTDAPKTGTPKPCTSILTESPSTSAPQTESPPTSSALELMYSLLLVAVLPLVAKMV